MKQNRIRLTESQLQSLISESVKKTLKEGWFGFGKQKQQSGYDTYYKQSGGVHSGDSHYVYIARIAEKVEEMKKHADEYVNASHANDWAKVGDCAWWLMGDYEEIMHQAEAGWKLARMFANRQATDGNNTQQNSNVQR